VGVVAAVVIKEIRNGSVAVLRERDGERRRNDDIRLAKRKRRSEVSRETPKVVQMTMTTLMYDAALLPVEELKCTLIKMQGISFLKKHVRTS